MKKHYLLLKIGIIELIQEASLTDIREVIIPEAAKRLESDLALKFAIDIFLPSIDGDTKPMYHAMASLVDGIKLVLLMNCDSEATAYLYFSELIKAGL